ncbi:FAR-RED IMPAIRED RESPONSE 1 protein [Nymphaea thermarum]|nr:FAR-RED IMPAIRED RESPONSE 1 protein [Nymphaea thermarum]
MDVFAHQVEGIENMAHNKKQPYEHILKIEDNNYANDGDETRIFGNYFWVVAISHKNYQYSEGIVSFDRTYKKTNTICHLLHLQICRLLFGEEVETFKWPFKEWLNTMSCQTHISIVTNQNVAMRKL